MRRSLALLGAALGTGLAVLAGAGTAAAAAVPGSVPAVQQAQSGCVNAKTWPFVVKNDTTAPAFVFAERDCSGPVVSVVAPGQTEVSEFGQSALFQS
ncbi:hypothetical protein [Streptomyces sp. CA2R106]|uniref:hypothetical protein n=1 Tax=Streptomyces sp. CA2R106 TaxID=3120153 RepID=UPI00300A4BC0